MIPYPPPVDAALGPSPSAAADEAAAEEELAEAETAREAQVSKV